MELPDFRDYERLLEHQIGAMGLSARFSNDMDALVRTYASVNEGSQFQRRFWSGNADSRNFWVCLAHGGQPVALTGFRTLVNVGPARRVGEAFSRGALYRAQGTRAEDWIRDSGPALRPGTVYGYMGAAWVHPDWRGRNLIGVAARLVQAEGVRRNAGTLDLITALYRDTTFKAGVGLRASGAHHIHHGNNVVGYWEPLDDEITLVISHITVAELKQLYRIELEMLRKDEPIPWLHGRDKSLVSEVLAKARLEETQEALA